MNAKAKGFSLIELAVVLAIVGLLIAGAIGGLAGMNEQRDRRETMDRLDTAIEAIIGFAIINRRLPCPAPILTTTTSVGDESFTAGTCTNPYNGLLPARALGISNVNERGLAIDAWGNPLRYAVAVTTAVSPNCPGTIPHLVHANNLKTNGLGCQPTDITILCSTAAVGAWPTCNSTVNIAQANTIAFLVFSTGKNGAISNYGADELENGPPIPAVLGLPAANATFIYRTPGESGSVGGMYDDLMKFVPAGILYGRLVAAGVLP